MTQNADQGAVVDPHAIMNLELDEEGEGWTGSIRRLFAERNRFFLMLGVFLKLSLISAKAHKVSYCISFFSVFLVVFLCIILVSVIFNLPIIFLRLGEAYNGQNDLFLLPGGELGSWASLNYSTIEELFPPEDTARNYHSPRITLSASIVNFADCTGVKEPKDLWYSNNGRLCRKGCVGQHCHENDFSLRVVAINSERETRMGFGTSWKGPPLAKGEVVLSKVVAIAVNNTKVGDTVVISAEFGTPLRALLQNVPSVGRNARAIMPFRVVAIIPPDRSKLDVEDFAVIDYDSLVATVAEGLHDEVNREEVERFARRDPRLAASSIYFNLDPKVRMHTYKTTDYSLIRRHISTWVTSIAEPIGYNQISVNTPIVKFLYSVRFFSLFVGLLVSIILVSLAFLSVMLIYSLLNLTVESRVYELGIKRMIGFSGANLVFMLLTNAYSFTIPAWLLGLLTGQLVFLGLRKLVHNMIGVELPHFISGQAVGWATLAGLLLPLVGAILPVITILSQKLPDALNATRGRNVGVVYKIIREGDTRALRYMLFGIGLAFFVFGFLLYYFFPAVLMRMRLDWLFVIFFGVLLGMLAGLVLLAVNFERVLQTSAAYLFFFWENDAVFQAFQRCLVAHRKRNRKTTLMYAFSLGFILFITIAFQVQLRSFQHGVRRSMGADVVIEFESIDLFKFAEMARHVQTSLPQVSAITFLSNPVSRKLHVQNVTLYSPGRYEGALMGGFRAISPNYFEVLDKEFLRVNKYDRASRKYSLSGALYTVNRNRVIMSTSVYSTLQSKSLSDAALLVIGSITDSVKRSVENVRYAVKPSAVLDAAPQVPMSKYRGMTGALLTSFPSLARLSAIDYLSVRSLTLSTVSLRVPNASQVEFVSQKMSSYIRRSRITKFIIRDDGTTAEYLGIAERMLGFFFTFTQGITMAICCFSLLASMTANVSESTKEIGIYLCIGMTKPQIYRIFIWEAFVVVIASAVLGLIVGVMVGYSMQLQNQLFSQMDVAFTFPYLQVVVVFVMAVAAALLSSCPPVAFILRLPSVTHILRRTT
ncbi:permease, family protein [Trypanosoma conorhini]|uniref:Permease, family protein n=1 Tax=Trypanosoma conorhini TaxID=83891 RepID=A0A422PYM1_9TRYP|nr:permease, family protein [Trypanosoma conorhini]RNF22587.1 permease, family protein [Trypanosoma conorhini]